MAISEFYANKPNISGDSLKSKDFTLLQFLYVIKLCLNFFELIKQYVFFIVLFVAKLEFLFDFQLRSIVF